MCEPLRPEERRIRVLWLAGPDLHVVLGRPLLVEGVSLLLPASLEEAGAVPPDVVLLGDDGGDADLAELVLANPGLSDVPVLPVPGCLARLDGEPGDAVLRLLTGAVRALAGARPAAERRRYQGEMAARLRSEIGELRMTRLVEVAAAMSRQAMPAEVAAVVLTQGVQALCADAGYVALRRGDVLDLVFEPTFPEEAQLRFRQVPMTSALPCVDCIRERRTFIYASPEEIFARYPDMPNTARYQTWVYLPLMVDDHATGAIGLFYGEPISFGEDDRRYMDLLARQCALALERARLYELEREARRAREEALAIAAHDLRTPLSSISLSAELLAQSDDERIRHRGRVIRTAAERAGELLRDLLDAAVIEQSRLGVHVAPCDGAALLGELRELFAPLAEARGIELRVGSSGDASAVAVDRARMHQALANLLGNALKFTPEGGTVEVRLEASEGAIRFVVRDDGPGIAPHEVPRLFDRYWQARAMNRGGAGLGLYIVKGIAEAHGGRVQVDTALGAGTTFTLVIDAGAR